MAVLLLRLDGPMQSWGTRSRFDDRDTERFPSKSGVIGLICAAMGRPREAPLDDLAALRMAARADVPGRLETDYQTAMDIPTASGSGSRTLPSLRHYLADAAFLVGLEGDAALLAQVDAALRRPVWPLSLGRKSFPPGEPIWWKDGLLPDGELREAMTGAPWLGAGRRHLRGWRRPAELEFEWEAPSGRGLPRADVPLSFALGARRYGVRHVIHERIPLPLPVTAPPDAGGAQ